MPEIAIEREPTLDVLIKPTPALSAVSDMPVIETKPDSAPPPDIEADDVESAATDLEEDAGKTGESESATDSTDEEPGEPEGKKKSRGVQKKLDELRREAEDARRAAEAERQEKLRLLALVEQRSRSPEQAEQPAVVEDTAPLRPNRADYDNDDAWDSALLEYADAKADWSARQTVKAEIARQRQEAENRAIADAQNRQREVYQERVKAAREKHEDYVQYAENPDVVVSIPMSHALIHAENGPELQYYLGKNPAEAKRIAQLSPPLQLMELGIISAKLRAPEAAPSEPETRPAAIVSKAPAPIKPIRGNSSPVSKSPETMSMDEYKAWRASGGGS